MEGRGKVSGDEEGNDEGSEGGGNLVLHKIVEAQ
jgi:hypothetical protein